MASCVHPNNHGCEPRVVPFVLYSPKRTRIRSKNKPFFPSKTFSRKLDKKNLSKVSEPTHQKKKKNILLRTVLPKQNALAFPEHPPFCTCVSLAFSLICFDHSFHLFNNHNLEASSQNLLGVLVLGHFLD